MASAAFLASGGVHAPVTLTNPGPVPTRVEATGSPAFQGVDAGAVHDVTSVAVKGTEAPGAVAVLTP